MKFNSPIRSPSSLTSKLTTLLPVLQVCEEPGSAAAEELDFGVGDVDLIAIEVEDPEEDGKDKLVVAAGEPSDSDIYNSELDNSEGRGGTDLDVMLVFFCAVVQKSVLQFR